MVKSGGSSVRILGHPYRDWIVYEGRPTNWLTRLFYPLAKYREPSYLAPYLSWVIEWVGGRTLCFTRSGMGTLSTRGS